MNSPGSDDQDAGGAGPAAPPDASPRPAPDAGVPHEALQAKGPASLVDRFLPGVAVARTYRREWLAGDLGAGLTLTAFLVPVGMGYAQAAGLSPISGLYATIFPLLAYALFGPSRVLVLGPDSSLAALIAAIVLPLAAGDPARAAGLAAGLALWTGLVIAGAGLFRLGFATDLLSWPVQLGYLSGVALLIAVSQLPKLLGLDLPPGDLLANVQGIFAGVVNGEVDPVTLALGAGALVLLAVARRLGRRVPGPLVVVVAGTALAWALGLEGRGVDVLGTLPQGLPHFLFPREFVVDGRELAIGALGIALVVVADTTVLSQSLSAARKEEVSADSELVALGAANLAAGLFGGFPISGSASRTPVSVAAGARTQLTGVVGAACVTLLLVFGHELLRSLPQAVLAAVVISAAMGLPQPAAIRRVYEVNRREFAFSVITFAGVLLVGVIQGIILAVVLSLLEFVRRAWRPHDAVLGRVFEREGYHDIGRHPDARLVPGLVLYRFDAPLFFANARHFRDHVRAILAEQTTPTAWLVIAAEPITDVDASAMEILEDLIAELHPRGVKVVFAELKGPVKDSLQRAGLLDKLGPDTLFPTVDSAVAAYRRVTRVDFVDWQEERGDG